ncbi:MAG: M20/M25/M40 family metallo-hydrolase [Williamsia sp.]|nr:M20/M25/M40 family metallo-hydrolase [Williamsia sp.]
MRKSSIVFLLMVSFQPLFSQEEKIDLGMVEKIRQEGLKNSQVMETVFYLTDANGPRLQGSAGYTKAANWAKDKLASYGLQDAKLEPWGEFGRGWEMQKSYLALTAPYYRPINAFPKSQCKGSDGAKNAEVVMINAKDSTELMSYKGKLKGKIVITPAYDTLKPTYRSDASRYTDDELVKMGEYTPPTGPQQGRGQFGAGGRGRFGAGAGLSPVLLRSFAQAEGAVAILSSTTRNHDGTLFVQGSTGAPGVQSYAANAPESFLDMVVGIEDYNTIYRLVKHNIPVKLDIDVKTSFSTKDTKGYNVVAEIKGTDPKLKEELVMLGGHLDSWHSGTGATDNAAGCATMIEAVRILKAVGFQPRRTIRIALWGGEETGLNGSRGYVRNHFVDTAARKANAMGEKVSVYFNLDNGTGKIRGIYTQGNVGIKPIFAKWFEPFKDLGATTVTSQNTGGTDHQSFDPYGIPAFQFIQDGMEYNTRTHHSTMDTYDHLSPDDLMQASTIIADFVYNAAQRDEKMPRKPQTNAPAGGRLTLR